MPKQTRAGVTPRAIDLRPPRAAVRFAQWYLVDQGKPSQRWVTGYDLAASPAPVKISAIAWRV